jgi:CheY-like chemotaxis protein
MNVLLIEDNPDDVAAIERLVQTSRLPAEITVRPTGRAALDWLGRVSPRPDLILLDLGLPDVPGRAVLQQIKADPRVCDVPVIVLSGSNNDDDILEGVRLGAHSHITKPISLCDFAWIVASVRKVQPRLSALRGVQEGR